MWRTEADRPTFAGSPAVPATAYLAVIAVLSGLLFVTQADSPSPVLGVVWGGFLVALTIGTLGIEGVSARSVLPPARTFVAVSAVLLGFWGAYNLVAYGLALTDVPGFEATWSRVAGHPLPYLAALFSSVLFTAIPEELFFRAYLQQKAVALIGDKTHRANAAGIVVATVLFALFHLPRWFASGHAVGTTLAVRLFGLALMGLAYGLVYAMTGNLWLVVLFHATMNQPPLLVAVSLPSELHLLVGIVEYTAIVSVVALSGAITEWGRPALGGVRREGAS